MERRGRESRMKQKQTSRREAVATGWEREAGEDGVWRRCMEMAQDVGSGQEQKGVTEEGRLGSREKPCEGGLG